MVSGRVWLCAVTSFIVIASISTFTVTVIYLFKEKLQFYVESIHDDGVEFYPWPPVFNPASTETVTRTIFINYTEDLEYDDGGDQSGTHIFEINEDNLRGCDCSSNRSDDTENINANASLGYFPNSNQCPLSIRPIGGLETYMLEYATLIGLANLNERVAFILPDMYLKLQKYFPSISLPVYQVQPLERKGHWTQIFLGDLLEKGYTNLPCKPLFFKGFEFSFEFFHHMRKTITEEFQFDAGLKENVHTFLLSIKTNDNVTLVGISTRRGRHIEQYRRTYVEQHFLDEAMAYFNQTYGDVLFVLASDDLEGSMKSISSNRYVVNSDWNKTPSDPGQDLALLSQCNHTIFDGGAFGFWAAYLAGGEAVFLIDNDDFLLPNRSNYFPSWVGIKPT